MVKTTTPHKLGPTQCLPPSLRVWQAPHFLNTFLPAAASPSAQAAEPENTTADASATPSNLAFDI